MGPVELVQLVVEFMNAVGNPDRPPLSTADHHLGEGPVGRDLEAPVPDGALQGTGDVEFRQRQDRPWVRAEPVDQVVLVISHREDALAVALQDVFNREGSVELGFDRDIHSSHDKANAEAPASRLFNVTAGALRYSRVDSPRDCAAAGPRPGWRFAF